MVIEIVHSASVSLLLHVHIQYVLKICCWGFNQINFMSIAKGPIQNSIEYSLELLNCQVMGVSLSTAVYCL